jgi:ABC-type nitrate/sulfonate/bicarbonate transport system substrate-binding protein
MPTATVPIKKSTAITPRPLRLGFIELIHAAPLIVAHEQGFFRRHGVRTELSREVGWATIRDKLIYRELDAAHALGAMLISTTLGLRCLPCECLTACVLNLNGNGLTFSEELWQLGVRDGPTLRAEIARVRGQRTFVIGIVFEYSAHHILLCDWLRAAGIDPGRDLSIVVVPPAQLFRNLVAGTLDGFCAGEPWNSLAVREKAGWCAAVSTDLAPGHPEKVFMVTADFADRRPEEHLAMVAAIAEAAALCDQPSFRPELARLLARPEYLNLAASVIAASLVGPFDYGHGRRDGADQFIQFHRGAANDPTPAKAKWLLDGFTRNGFLPAGVSLPPNLAGRLFRSDLFHAATKRLSSAATGPKVEATLAPAG